MSKHLGWPYEKDPIDQFLKILVIGIKQGSLFSFLYDHAETLHVVLPSCCPLHTLGKLSMSKDAPTWFEIVSSYIVEAIDY
jgi:hypothetical protein